MSTLGPRERARVVVTVKAYPSISDEHGEAVCCAGMRIDGGDARWIRLFPVPYRTMGPEQRFEKYDVIDIDIRRTADDNRPESWLPVMDTLRVTGHLSSKGGWVDRAPYVEPLVMPSMCQAQRESKATGVSLCAFRPAAVIDLTVTPRQARDAGKEGMAQQIDMLEPSRKALEDLPYTFRYKWRCREEPGCRGHHQTILDWEIGQAYRSWRTKYADEATVLAMIKQKWLEEIPSRAHDLILFAGNQNSRRNVWCVLGAYYPPVQRQEALFPQQP